MKSDLVRPDSEGVRRDFGVGSVACVEVLPRLRKAFREMRRCPSARAAFEEWRRILTTVHGDGVANDDLYLRHTYLSVVARSLAWAALRPRDEPPPSGAGVDRIAGGEALRDLGIENQGEGELFAWAGRPEVSRALRPAWSQVLATVARYDLDAQGGDILKGVYQDLVDPETRHDLGEHYTPDWLAERVVRQALERAAPDDPIVRTIDPTCGSGSFLRALIAALLGRLWDRPPAERLRLVTSCVSGLDVHPLAVVIARTTYVLAIKQLVPHRSEPVNLPVYRADALFQEFGDVVPRAFDLVVGNPPWLSYRYITEPGYQARVKALADRYGLAMKAALWTQLELAAVFLLSCTETYLKDGGSIGFVMPRSVFNGDQHDALRRMSYEAPCRIDGVWDLRGVEPVFNVPACVLWAMREEEFARGGSILCEKLEGRLTGKDMPAADAEQRLHVSTGTLACNYLGEHTCWGAPLLTRRRPASRYLGRFHQGATIVPRNFWFVRPSRETFPDDALVYVRTDEEQASEAKPPYRDERMEGEVEARFLYRAVLAKHILPFAVAGASWVVLPASRAAGGYAVEDVADLRHAGFPNMARWLDHADTKWRELRGSKARDRRLVDYLDYRRKLSDQDPRASHLVLYNASGKHIAAALAPGRAPLLRKGSPPIVDAKCYWCEAESEDEAHYLVGVLNSGITGRLVKPFQSVGLLGERDVHKKVLSLPIPLFDPRSRLHRDIAAIARSAAGRAAGAAGAAARGTLGARRNVIRRSLAQEMARLDALTAEALEIPLTAGEDPDTTGSGSVPYGAATGTPAGGRGAAAGSGAPRPGRPAAGGA